jgi:Zn-dependent alcohol dehydrogenase
MGYVKAMTAEVFHRNGTSISQFAGIGSMAELTVVAENACIPIEADVPLDRACLIGCGVMTGVGAVINTARVRPGQSVAVFGAGGVGLNVIQGAVLAGANPIIAIDLNERKLGFARQFGATHTVNAGSTDPVSAVLDLTGMRGADYAFEVIGRPEVVTQAFMAIRRGGKAVVVGVPPATAMVSVPGMLLPLAEKSLVGSLYGSANMARDVPRLIDLYRAGKLKLDELITRRYKIAQVSEAFAAMEKGEVARGVITF